MEDVAFYVPRRFFIHLLSQPEAQTANEAVDAV